MFTPIRLPVFSSHEPMLCHFPFFSSLDIIILVRSPICNSPSNWKQHCLINSSNHSQFEPLSLNLPLSFMLSPRDRRNWPWILLAKLHFSLWYDLSSRFGSLVLGTHWWVKIHEKGLIGPYQFFLLSHEMAYWIILSPSPKLGLYLYLNLGSRCAIESTLSILFWRLLSLLVSLSPSVSLQTQTLFYSHPIPRCAVDCTLSILSLLLYPYPLLFSPSSILGHERNLLKWLVNLHANLCSP